VKSFIRDNVYSIGCELILKTLVVYYSRTGNAKFMAETIAAELGSDLEEVIDLRNRQGKLAFLPAGRDAMRGRETEIA